MLTFMLYFIYTKYRKGFINMDKTFQVYYTCPYRPIKNSLRISFGSIEAKFKPELENMVTLVKETILEKHFPKVKYYPCTLPLDQPGFITRVNAGLTIDFTTEEEIFNFLGYFQKLLLSSNNPLGSPLAEIKGGQIVKK